MRMHWSSITEDVSNNRQPDGLQHSYLMVGYKSQGHEKYESIQF